MNAWLCSRLLRLRNRHFVAVDLLLLALTPTLALLIRMDTIEQVLQYGGSIILVTGVSLVWKPILFYYSGLYRRYWPSASIDALGVLVVATGLALVAEVLTYSTMQSYTGWLRPDFPRSVPIISGILTILLIGASRLSLRMLFEMSHRQQVSRDGRLVLIAGAGMAGTMVVKELRSNPQLALVPVGFLDDDPAKIGLLINGVRVLGPLSQLGRVARERQALEVIIAMPTAPGQVIRAIHQACKDAGITDRTLPGIYEILDGSAKVSQIREVEIEDLLRRGVVRVETDGLAQVVSGRCIMVTGAGGSIGSELCRQLAGVGPADLVLVGHGENSIFTIAGELQKHSAVAGGGIRLHPVIADMRDRDRMERIFAEYRPAVVFHAAAHKHVGLMEANLPDAVSNNVLGTRILCDLAIAYGAERFVMISSDKAVNPTCVMGVTKRIAELIVRDAAVRSGKAFVSVRFGNVLGSRGSVVPIFKAQIAAGGPVSVTHPDATRYFMTIPEAVHLVLQAGVIGRGGEVLVLDMGEPIKIQDLARDVIRLSGFEEGRDIDIVFTGLQKGEKLHEELFYAAEIPTRSSHEKIFVCQNSMQHTISGLLSEAGISGDLRELAESDGPPVLAEVEHLVAAAASGRPEEAQKHIKRLVPQFVPAGRLVHTPRKDIISEIPLVRS